ncbi:DNA repair protein (plasmid) [Methylomonas sp. EFPC1]|uniref:DNA repair protein n=1 Tax=Methylomonas rosea TaxID=2952227 RepID=A0ABT1TUS0_9GAMM|nr:MULTISPECIES: JAB domain-containing protein [unclassified Methylomonas]MCQ8118526.1 DNA repair protein [Methylomonas sp. WSC-7]PPD24609.1 MAG: DNA repair protein RadC [Methylobacter sp.]QSB03820.1 DNA repair protein [Methylomonas sp. EFPC1]
MTTLTADQQAIIRNALAILETLFQKQDLSATSPDTVKDFCRLHFGHLEHEEFGLLFLDNQHRLIKYESIAKGTVDSCSVYPREIVKAVLACNGCALVAYHNHPSGVLSPSDADMRITQKLREALALIDVRILDHIIVSNQGAYSFAEHGLI